MDPLEVLVDNNYFMDIHFPQVITSSTEAYFVPFLIPITFPSSTFPILTVPFYAVVEKPVPPIQFTSLQSVVTPTHATST